ncbi:4-hydroxybenzoate synthetase [Cohnella panacarvi]|uniref:4-hydroxybenzoate synthetase n=1 Tax=Cohnella panacarvi TaxID=400776 RepID=UPI00047BBD4E|nr:4-hydroxybenzoate synthetase [Cohnella panacarvi]
MVDMYPGIEQYMLDQLHQLLFDILLATDGRTTDILETLLDEKMKVEVVRQQQIDESAALNVAGLSSGPYYVRESLLIGDQSRFIVSHNIALVCSQHVPPAMFEALAARQEGIGKTIGDLGLQTSRRLSDCGWRAAAETVDLFGIPIELRFTSSQSTDRTPYKRYAIYFGDKAGIHLLEYFNPDIVRHRLLRGSGW